MHQVVVGRATNMRQCYHQLRYTYQFREMYLHNEDDRLNWEASPLLAPEDVFRKAPRAWIGVGEMDVLCNESEAYAERLNKCGVEAECVVYKGGTHVIFLLDST